jgi:hypothetical protein
MSTNTELTPRIMGIPFLNTSINTTLLPLEASSNVRQMRFWGNILGNLRFNAGQPRLGLPCCMRKRFSTNV